MNKSAIRTKFFVSLLFACLWVIVSVYLSIPWLTELSSIFGFGFAIFAITFIAYIPGFTNFFLVSSLLMDKRPETEPISEYPDLSVLIAAFNEEEHIADTLQSVIDQDYNGNLQIVVVNDGSEDNTADIVKNFITQYSFIDLVDLEENVGKANALNAGFDTITTDLIVTIDGDTSFHTDAINNIVERYENDSENVAAIAGAIVVKNIFQSFITRLQAWDYFIGISAVKRVQSMYQGTLVAQGAFSLYRRDVIEEVGKWPDTVGEDIVLTWGILKKGYRVLHAENAVSFTHAPETIPQFWKQRIRWARGMIEALKEHGTGLLTNFRLASFFIWWNFLFPILDAAFTFIFIPGVILALFFQIFWIAGPYTLLVFPLALILNAFIGRTQMLTLNKQKIFMEGNMSGLIMYILLYGIIMIPAVVYGYLKEIFNAEKKWGTK